MLISVAKNEHACIIYLILLSFTENAFVNYQGLYKSFIFLLFAQLSLLRVKKKKMINRAKMITDKEKEVEISKRAAEIIHGADLLIGLLPSKEDPTVYCTVIINSENRDSITPFKRIPNDDRKLAEYEFNIGALNDREILRKCPGDFVYTAKIGDLIQKRFY